MRKILLAAVFALVATGANAGTCKTDAVSKEGKPLAGAALKSFMTKCKRDVTAACTKDSTDQCTPKAVGSNGKPLAGAALKSFMNKCTKDATAKCVSEKTG